MALTNSSNSLAEALNKAKRADGGPGSDRDPLIDRLATALAILPPPSLQDPADDDDLDEDLDLPMLVQGSRVPAVVPVPPVKQHAREGRAALIGFGLGLILLVPIGVVMSNRLPDPGVAKADLTGLPATLLPTTAVAVDTGIRTTVRPTQAITAFEPVAPAARVQPSTTLPIAVAALPPSPVVPIAPPPIPASAPPAPPPPDHLAIAAALIAKGEIAAARLKIAAADPEANPQAAMALAETFDPNMLAAWGARGVDADVRRARALYGRALGEGILKAKQRLDALD